MTDLYVILPSDASMDVFPYNTVTSYHARLARALNLEGDWEVALPEINYPTTWINIAPEESWFRIKICNQNLLGHTKKYLPSQQS